MNMGCGFKVKKSHEIKKYMGEIKKPWTWFKWETMRVFSDVELTEISLIGEELIKSCDNISNAIREKEKRICT